VNNIIQSCLLSFFLHGAVLACCFAVPAQKLLPLFQTGNSSLTLTALSISAPEEEQSQTYRKTAERKSALEIESADRDDLPEEPEVESAAADDPDDFPAIPEKKPAAPAAPKPANRQAPVDADARLKGVSGIPAESAGIRPYYPLGARLRGEEGIVKVEVCVGSSGQVLDCALAKSSGYSALDDAALKAVKSARFISAKALPLQNENKTVLTFRFDLVN
jgi:TonB family protein